MKSDTLILIGIILLLLVGTFSGLMAFYTPFRINVRRLFGRSLKEQMESWCPNFDTSGYSDDDDALWDLLTSKTFCSFDSWTDDDRAAWVKALQKSCPDMNDEFFKLVPFSDETLFFSKRSLKNGDTCQGIPYKTSFRNSLTSKCTGFPTETLRTPNLVMGYMKLDKANCPVSDVGTITPESLRFLSSVVENWCPGSDITFFSNASIIETVYNTQHPCIPPNILNRVYVNRPPNLPYGDSSLRAEFAGSVFIGPNGKYIIPDTDYTGILFDSVKYTPTFSGLTMTLGPHIFDYSIEGYNKIFTQRGTNDRYIMNSKMRIMMTSKNTFKALSDQVFPAGVPVPPAPPGEPVTLTLTPERRILETVTDVTPEQLNWFFKTLIYDPTAQKF